MNTVGARNDGTLHLASSSNTRHMPSALIPPPPYSSGRSNIQKPSSLALSCKRLRTSSGMSGWSAYCASSGINSSPTKRRAESRNMRSSSGIEKSIAVAVSVQLDVDVLDTHGVIGAIGFEEFGELVWPLVKHVEADASNEFFRKPGLGDDT